MTRIALTGGTGFIGANLARALLARGDEVHLLNRAQHTTWRIEPIRRDLAIHTVDLADTESVQDAFRAIRAELVVHLAQTGGYPWQTDVGAMVRTNYLACVNLVRAAEEFGARLVVNTGSSLEYGPTSRPARESDAPRPANDYAATKAACTFYCRHRACGGAPAVPTLRLYSIYGPFEEPRRLMPRLVMSALEGRLPPLASPDTARDFVYVDDAIAAYLRVIDAPTMDPGTVFNICSGRQATLRAAVETARRVLGVTAEPSWNATPPRTWDTDTWVGDPAFTAHALGWRATTGLESGIRQFAEWLKSEPGMRAHYRDAPER